MYDSVPQTCMLYMLYTLNQQQQSQLAWCESRDPQDRPQSPAGFSHGGIMFRDIVSSPSEHPANANATDLGVTGGV